MGSEERTKYYSKKPKNILVMDCTYLESERDRMAKELSQARRDNDEINRRLMSMSAKLSCLGHVNGKLTDALTSLRDGVLIGS